LSYLNKYRSSGLFEISKHCFDIIGDILNHILDKVIIDKDFESARYCLILSQTYHYIDENKKISLQQKLENHLLFHTIDFWESFIACIIDFIIDSIYEEIEKQNKIMGNNENDHDKNQRIVNTVFSQLYPICDNMLTFMLEKEKIKELISGFSKQYSLGQELDDHLIKIIDDYPYEVEQNKLKESPKSLERLLVKKNSLQTCENTPFGIEDKTVQNTQDKEDGQNIEQGIVINENHFDDIGLTNNYIIVENKSDKNIQPEI
jgi:hypothetical protein